MRSTCWSYGDALGIILSDKSSKGFSRTDQVYIDDACNFGNTTAFSAYCPAYDSAESLGTMQSGDSVSRSTRSEAQDAVQSYYEESYRSVFDHRSALTLDLRESWVHRKVIMEEGKGGIGDFKLDVDCKDREFAECVADKESKRSSFHNGNEINIGFGCDTDSDPGSVTLRCTTSELQVFREGDFVVARKAEGGSEGIMLAAVVTNIVITEDGCGSKVVIGYVVEHLKEKSRKWYVKRKDVLRLNA